MINATRAARLDSIEDDLLDLLDYDLTDVLAPDVLDLLDTYEEDLRRNGDL